MTVCESEICQCPGSEINAGQKVLHLRSALRLGKRLLAIAKGQINNNYVISLSTLSLFFFLLASLSVSVFLSVCLRDYKPLSSAP